MLALRALRLLTLARRRAATAAIHSDLLLGSARRKVQSWANSLDGGLADLTSTWRTSRPKSSCCWWRNLHLIA